MSAGVVVPYSPADDWPDADLSVLNGPNIPPPPFPVAVLGEWWGEWVETAAKGANAPTDYPAAGLLTIAGTLIGNARVVAASPDWYEPPILWAMLLGAPSAGKSPALDPLVRVVESFEAEGAAAFSIKARQHAAEAEAAKARKETWTQSVRNAVKDGAPPPPLPTDADGPAPPIRPRVRLSDTTLEAAADLSGGNPKGLVLVRDELAGWWRGFNRYGGDGERQFWLQAYGARPYVVDRKKVAEPVMIDRLAISVLGGVQPDVLSDMLAGEADGFAARFLYAYPDPVKGFSLAAHPVDHRGAEAALARLRGLALVDDGEGARRPFICKLASPAAALFERWWSARRAEASDESGLWGGWLGKQGGHVLRLALILEHLWWCAPYADSAESADSPPREVSARAVGEAIALIDGWASPMAKRAFGASAATAEEADTAALGRWLRRAGLRVFNAREARRSSDGPGGRLASAAAMSAACRGLEAAGLIRYVGGRAGEGPGRRREDYAVHPLLAART
jgi:hypothetical protein